MEKITTLEMEIKVADFFCFQRNLIVPGISWGLQMHECDLLVLTPANYAWEVEIKISKADLVKDRSKTHGHYDLRISRLYFAIPEYLQPEIKHIPERAGILIVKTGKRRCVMLRKPKKSRAPYKFTEQERLKMAELGAMRLWGLKRKIRFLNIKNEKHGQPGTQMPSRFW